MYRFFKDFIQLPCYTVKTEGIESKDLFDVALTEWFGASVSRVQILCQNLIDVLGTLLKREESAKS